MKNRRKDALTDLVENLPKPAPEPQPQLAPQPNNGGQQVTSSGGERVTLGNEGGINKDV